MKRVTTLPEDNTAVGGGGRLPEVQEFLYKNKAFDLAV